MYNKTIKKGVDTMTTKTHRTTVYVSFHFDAMFFAYYKEGKLVSLRMEGSDNAINGEVDRVTFYAEMKKVFIREGREDRELAELYESCSAIVVERTRKDENLAVAHAKLNKMLRRF